jgi:hypothetical protein
VGEEEEGEEGEEREEEDEEAEGETDTFHAEAWRCGVRVTVSR